MRYHKFMSLLRTVTLAALAIPASNAVFAAPPPSPTYTPLFTANFEGNTVGSTIQEFETPTTPAKLTYSNAMVGPHGGLMTARQENQSGKKAFGGKILNTSLRKGKEVWVRWYEYFPASFCFANGTNGDSNGGAGKMKWLRFQYPNNTTRVTVELDGTSSCTAPCNSCVTQMKVDSVIGEAMGWNNIKRGVGGPGFPRGQWNALQVYMYLDDKPASAGGNGRIRIWINDQLIREITDVPTLDSATSKVASIWWGNYWNGGFPNDQHWFLDEVIITSNRPNTVDSGGRPYIHPDTRIADFGIAPGTPVGFH